MELPKTFRQWADEFWERFPGNWKQFEDSYGVGKTTFHGWKSKLTAGSGDFVSFCVRVFKEKGLTPAQTGLGTQASKVRELWPKDGPQLPPAVASQRATQIGTAETEATGPTGTPPDQEPSANGGAGE